MTTLLLASVAE
jgi:hypothetical protein